MPFDPSLRDRLCELEPQDPLLRERYTKEVRAMFEAKLSVPMKGFVALVGVASVVIAVYLGTHAVIHDKLPSLARAGLAAGALFSVAWAVMCAWTARRGAFLLLTDTAKVAALAWTSAVLMETCFLVLAPQFPDHFYAMLAIATGLVILIGAGVMLVCARVQHAELRTREALLRLEYRLAEMAEGGTKAP